MVSTAISRIDGVSTSVAVKAPVHAVATTNITLSGLQTVGGVTLDGSTLYRVLLTGQTDTTQNGIYDASTGSWTRSDDFDGEGDIVAGTLICAPKGSLPLYYRVTGTNPITPGTSAISFDSVYQLAGGTVASTSLQYEQTPAESAAGVTPVNYYYPARPWLDVKREGCVLDGVTDDYAAFNRCISVAASTNTGLVIDGPMLLNTSITIPVNVQLWFVGNGKLKPANTRTVTLNSSPVATPLTIFDTSLGGTIAGTLGGSDLFTEWFGAVGDGTTNDITAFTNANTIAASVGGVIRLLAKQYKLTSEWTVGSGVSVIGAGKLKGAVSTREGVTSILGVHTGRSVVSTQGSIGYHLADFCIEAGAGTVPKTGLLCGRSSAASVGHSKIDISVYGYYSIAPIYSIASEDVIWYDPQVWLFGGGAKYCFYTGISDALAVGGSLTTSSNLNNKIIGGWITNTSSDANAACIFIQGAQAVGSWSFFGTYLTANAGSYVQIDTGTIDSLDCLGPFLFDGVGGEIYSGGDPTYCYRLSVTGANRTLPGLTINGGRFQLSAGSSHYQVYQDSALYLGSPNIHLEPPEAFPYALNQLVRSQIKNGNITVGRYAEWVQPTLAGTWVNSFGAPVAQFSYMMDGFGRVFFRGTIQGGAGTIFTLPADYRPASDQRYTILIEAGTVAQILITASTGVVSMTAGAGTAMDMTQITFDTAA